MSGHYPGYSSPNHQGNYPNQMVNQQMRNMPGVMGPMMNMQTMPNQMVNPMMGQQSMNYNQQAMQNPGTKQFSQFNFCEIFNFWRENNVQNAKLIYRYGRSCWYARFSSCSTNAHATTTKSTGTKHLCEYKRYFLCHFQNLIFRF